MTDKKEISQDDKILVAVVVFGLVAGFLNLLFGNMFWGWTSIGGAVLLMLFTIFLNSL